VKNFGSKSVGFYVFSGKCTIGEKPIFYFFKKISEFLGSNFKILKF
jgi:hypothetical protein